MTDPAVERVRALLDLREGQANTGGRGLVDDDGYVCVRVDDVRAMLPPVLTPAVPLREAEDEESALRQRMADLLTRTANALKGDPGPLRSWSWHDLPEVADDLAAARGEVARLREAVERIADEMETAAQDATPRIRDVWVASALQLRRRVLDPPVVPSGEAEF